MSNDEYQTKKFWEEDRPGITGKLFKLGIGQYKVSLGEQLMNDMLIWGQCAYKISDQGIERIPPNTWITNKE